VLTLWLWLGFAWAEDVVDLPVKEDAPAPVVLSEAEIWATLSPQDVLAEAVARRRVGDYVSAQRRLDHLTERAVLLPEAAYHRAILAEVQEDISSAEAGYRKVMETWPASPVAPDAAFRRAYCLEDLGEHRAALVAIKQLQRDGAWDEFDARTMALQRGIVEIRGGMKRRGIRRILKALDTVDPGNDQKWIRAKARLALIRVQVETARGIQLVGSKKAARRLKQRSSLMGAAEAQAIALFRLDEPEFALEALLLLGDAHMDLYQAMVEYPPPRSIPADFHAGYRAKVRTKSAILIVKAHTRYEEGVRLAARTQWQGKVTKVLKERRDATAPEAQGD